MSSMNTQHPARYSDGSDTGEQELLAAVFSPVPIPSLGSLEEGAEAAGCTSRSDPIQLGPGDPCPDSLDNQHYP
jgi:hypothetical protein